MACGMILNIRHSKNGMVIKKRDSLLSDGAINVSKRVSLRDN